MKPVVQLAFLLLASLFSEEAHSQVASRKVIVEVENVAAPHTYDRDNTPSTAPSIYPIAFGLHDGSVDFFDVGNEASPELGLLATEGLVAPIINKVRSQHGDDVVANIITNNYYGMDNSFEFESQAAREQFVLPTTHRFFSFVAKLGPSDDAFVGNDDPKRHALFDEAGKYMGPLTIVIYGADVYDAGVAPNNETDVAYLDREPNPAASIDPDGQFDPIRVHPGYNGSISNPDATPVGILGQRGDICDGAPLLSRCIEIEAGAGDFKRSGYVLAIIRVSSGLDGSFEGFWYDPARSGEGFNVSVHEGVPGVMSVAWYTYDENGEQLYLVGSGDLAFQHAEVELYRTRGGGFASVDNPADVELLHWGKVRLGFGACNEGRVFFEPLDPAFPTGDYFIHRVAPHGPGDAMACGRETLGLFNPPDNDWPWPPHFIEPDPGPAPDM